MIDVSAVLFISCTRKPTTGARVIAKACGSTIRRSSCQRWRPSLAPASHCPLGTASTPLPGGHIRDVGLVIADARREHDEGLPTDTIPHLIAAYGSRFRDVLDLAADRPEWRTRLAKDSPVIGAELVHAARKEMALTLADAVLRRTPLGALGDPGEVALERAAAIVGTERRWSDDRRRNEIAEVQRFYRGPERAALRT